MTTGAEIKRWMKPLLAAREDVQLRGRVLYLTPVDHILRGIFFIGSSDKTYPRPRWFLGVPFAPQSELLGGLWSAELPILHTTDEGFSERLVELLADAIDQVLQPVSSVEAFYELTLHDRRTEAGTGFWILEKYPVFHAPVLAALGRFDEAATVVERAVAASERRFLKLLAEGRALVANRKNSVVGRLAITEANRDLTMLAELKRLAELARMADRTAIAALLGDWEMSTVKRWGIDDFWRPSPFPLEGGSGD